MAFAEILGRFAMEKICGICDARADENEHAGDPNARWEETEHTNNARLWTSSLLRTIQTAAHIEHPTTNGEWEQMAPWRLSQHRRNLRRGLRGDDPGRDRGEAPAGGVPAIDG